MKSRRLIFAITLSLAVLIALAATPLRLTAQDQESSATLDETMSWISLHLREYSGTYPNPDIRLEYVSVKTEGCKLTFRRFDRHVDDEATANPQMIRVVLLNKVDPYSLKVEDSGIYSVLKGGGTNGQAIGTLDWPDQPNMFQPTSVFGLEFSSKDKDLSKRMQRALEHAIKLCGGKTEAF